MPTVTTAAVLDRADGGDRKFRQLLYDIASAATLLESARGYLAARLGVTSPQYNMIMVIAQYEADAGISVNEIAEHLHVSGTFVTVEIKKLERAGLVVKTPNPVDARSVLVKLSAEGEQNVLALEPELHFVNDHLFQRISTTDFESLSRIFSSLIGDFSRTVAMLQVASRAGGDPGLDEAGRENFSRALRRSHPRAG